MSTQPTNIHPAGPRPALRLAPGFADPVFDGQAAFRGAMDALARPGQVRPLRCALPPGTPLLPEAAALVLALCDFETQLHLSSHVAGRPQAAEFLTFHTGAPLASGPSRAAFALLDLSHDGLDLSCFAQGTAEYPDRSTTIIACCASLEGGPALTIAGPGIAEVAELTVAGLPDDFSRQWAANRAAFPLGVDIIFAAPGGIVGLPRSTRIVGEARGTLISGEAR